MTTNRFSVTDLDFDEIKQNLKEFLRSQTTFSDYNFEGSGLNVLLDILAYNTHYNAYYLNMVANESFLDSSILRNSKTYPPTIVFSLLCSMRSVLFAMLAFLFSQIP